MKFSANWILVLIALAAVGLWWLVSRPVHAAGYALDSVDAWLSRWIDDLFDGL